MLDLDLKKEKKGGTRVPCFKKKKKKKSKWKGRRIDIEPKSEQRGLFPS